MTKKEQAVANQLKYMKEIEDHTEINFAWKTFFLFVIFPVFCLGFFLGSLLMSHIYAPMVQRMTIQIEMRDFLLDRLSNN